MLAAAEPAVFPFLSSTGDPDLSINEFGASEGWSCLSRSLIKRARAERSKVTAGPDVPFLWRPPASAVETPPGLCPASCLALRPGVTLPGLSSGTVTLVPRQHLEGGR